MSNKVRFHYSAKTGTITKGCYCVGPQDGNPVCPCRMRNVRVEGGRYIEVHDLGEVQPTQAKTADSTNGVIG